MSPFVSEAQRKFFNMNRGRLESQGVNVDEWNKKSKGKKLPEHIGNKKHKKGKELLAKAFKKYAK